MHPSVYNARLGIWARAVRARVVFERAICNFARARVGRMNPGNLYTLIHTLILNLHINSKHTYTRSDLEFSPPFFNVNIREYIIFRKCRAPLCTMMKGSTCVISLDQEIDEHPARCS